MEILRFALNDNAYHLHLVGVVVISRLRRVNEPSFFALQAVEMSTLPRLRDALRGWRGSQLVWLEEGGTNESQGSCEAL